MVKKLPFHIKNIAFEILTYCTKIINCGVNNVIEQRHFRRKLVEQLFHGNISSLLGRPVLRVLEGHTGRHFLDMQMEGEKPPSSSLVHCLCSSKRERESERERKRERDATSWKPEDKRKSRCSHTNSFKCRQCNVSLCISPCFEIPYKRCRIVSDCSKEELFHFYNLFMQEERQNCFCLYLRLFELLFLWYIISFLLFSSCEISLK